MPGGQRRCIETISPSARQFFGRMEKPQVDSRRQLHCRGRVQPVWINSPQSICGPCHHTRGQLSVLAAQPDSNATQRSFYYSPSEHPKVTRDALHLLLAYQLEKTGRDGKTAFIPTRWKLITLQDLEVDLKFEFNQSNRGLYGKEAGAYLLNEGALD